MINLTAYKEYWERLAKRVPLITGVMPVTVDEEMGKRLNGMGKGSITLFYLPPTASGNGNTDSFNEANVCVIFIMKKYDPQRESAFDVLEQTQPVIEAIKQAMIDDLAAGCPVMRFEVSTLNTIPETEFYRSFAGWSLGFTVKTS